VGSCQESGPLGSRNGSLGFSRHSNQPLDLEPPNGIEPLTFSLPLGTDQPADEALHRKARSEAPLQPSWEQFGTVRERCDLPNSSQPAIEEEQCPTRISNSPVAVPAS